MLVHLVSTLDQVSSTVVSKHPRHSKVPLNGKMQHSSTVNDSGRQQQSMKHRCLVLTIHLIRQGSQQGLNTGKILSLDNKVCDKFTIGISTAAVGSMVSNESTICTIKEGRKQVRIQVCGVLSIFIRRFTKIARVLEM